MTPSGTDLAHFGFCRLVVNDPESMARFSRAVFGLQDWNRRSLEHSASVGGPIDEITSRATGAGGPSLTLIKKSGSARTATAPVF